MFISSQRSTLHPCETGTRDHLFYFPFSLVCPCLFVFARSILPLVFFCNFCDDLTALSANGHGFSDDTPPYSRTHSSHTHSHSHTHVPTHLYSLSRTHVLTPRFVHKDGGLRLTHIGQSFLLVLLPTRLVRLKHCSRRHTARSIAPSACSPLDCFIVFDPLCILNQPYKYIETVTAANGSLSSRAFSLTRTD